MARIEFFPVDIGSTIMGEKEVILLFSRTNSGKQIILIDDSFSPYFYVLLKEKEPSDQFIQRLKNLRINKEGTLKQAAISAENTTKQHHGKDVQLVKVILETSNDTNDLKKELETWPEVKEIFEHDIPFTKKYLVDKGITPMTLCAADAEEESTPKGALSALKARIPVLRITGKIQALTQVLEKPRILAFDIETYNPTGKAVLPEQHPILMIAFAAGLRSTDSKSNDLRNNDLKSSEAILDNTFKKVITWKKFRNAESYIEFVDSEAELIERAMKIIFDYNPDILAGYFSDGFDFPYIAARAKKYNITLNLGLDYSELEINKRADFTTAKIAGIAHLDVLNFIRRMMSQNLDTDSYKLQDVAEEILGEGKTDAPIDELAKVWDNAARAEELSTFCKYNLQDASLTLKLANKIMPNILELIKLVGIPIFDITRVGMSQLVEWYLIKQAGLHNQLIPNKPGYHAIRARREITFIGAFVYEPKPGLYSDIVVYDFRSLYPSIITSHNLSPATLNCECCDEETNLVPLERGAKERIWFCKKKRGFIPKIIEDLIKRRMRVKELIEEEKKDSQAKGKKYIKNPLLEARQNSLKLLANSFYGYLGFFAARWYSIESARATTAFGRHYIMLVINEAKKAGFDVLYSDTDSIFLSLSSKTKEDSKRFAEYINMQLPSIMELEFDGYYPKGLFVFTKESTKDITKESIKESTKESISNKAGPEAKQTRERKQTTETGIGAKKKYALLAEDNTVKIKGFETVRRNWSFIAKEAQENIINLVLKETNREKPLQYAKSIVQELRENKTPLAKVVIHTQLTKDISAYDSIGPHVAVAQRMLAKGMPVGPGTIIKFVIIKGEGIIRERARLPEEISQSDYDAAYYINNQIIPGVERILNLIGYTKEDIIGSQQKGLKSYFGK